ncbi:MAG: L,D-transpeptidase, partial [Verrucomicrobiota bacterium]
VFSSALDEPAVAENGKPLPLIRWTPGQDQCSAQVQLLGVLLADEERFSKFLESEDNDFGIIFEDAEVEAHGVRESITALAILGVTLGSVNVADAGPFKAFKERRAQAKAERMIQQQAIRSVPAPIPVVAQQSGWQDVHRDAYVNYEYLEAHRDGERRVVVDISKQRAFLIIDGVIAIDTAVSTARSGKHTPRGTFEITQRVAEGKTSTIYGCDLPYWMRLDESAIGMHVGDLPGYPASAGCIRLPHSVAPIMFEHTASGVTVEVVDSWDGLPASAPGSSVYLAQR